MDEGGKAGGTCMMREAFHDVSPCRTITTSVKSPPAAGYPSALEADDDIPGAASGARTRRICGKFAGPGGGDAATAEAGEGREAARDAIEGGGRRGQRRQKRARWEAPEHIRGTPGTRLRRADD